MVEVESSDRHRKRGRDEQWRVEMSSGGLPQLVGPFDEWWELVVGEKR
jgi:hypothetical protein